MTALLKTMLATVVVLLVFGLLMLWGHPARAEGVEYDAYTIPSITVTCTHPTTRSDGTALMPEELGSVDMYLSGMTGVYYSGPECGSKVSLGPLRAGQYYIEFTQWDTEGRESDRSEPYPFFLLNVAPPAPPDNVVITVN